MQKNSDRRYLVVKKFALSICFMIAMFALNVQDSYGSGGCVLDDIQKRVTVSMRDATLEQILIEINKQTGLDYGFQSNGKVDKNRKFSLDVKDATVKDALDTLLKGSPYDYVLEENRVVIIERKAQEPTLVEITGRVVDEKGNPIPGASVIVYGTTQGVATDVEGRYTLRVQPDAILQVSFVGYKTETANVNGKDRVNVTLNPTSENIEEVQVVAFGTQKKESVVASITTVKPMDLKSSSSDLTSSFAGRIPGMIAWQTGGLPAALTEEEMNTKFYIRGITSFQTNANIDPLILIDNVESSKLDLSRLAPEDIESFSVLKDASATAMYGARGANGVILVTTKKGEEGNVYTSVRYEAIASMPTRRIEVVDPITYMRMYNEALTTRNPDAQPEYSIEKIERTGDPRYPSFVYPANDWYDIMFKDYNVNHHMGVNVRGGSNKVQYYSSLNYNYDSGMLKTDPLNQFDCNIKNNTFTFRTNLTVDLNAGIQLLINTYASLDKYHGPLQDVTAAYALAFAASPVNFAATYPADDTYNWPHIRFGGTSLLDANPYAELQAGYKDRFRYSATARAEYIHNLSALVKGLELRGSLAINYEGYSSTGYTTNPFRYALANYDFETGEHTLSPLNEGNRTLSMSSGQTENMRTQDVQLSFEVRALHSAAWDNHQTSLLAVFAGQETQTSNIGSVLDGIPQRNMGFSMRGTYGYKDKYFIEASFGYNGSERFDEGHRWGFFPAVGGAWIASKEGFLSGASKWLSFLKFRLTWGEVGNDGIIASPRFTHLPVIGTVSTTNPKPFQSQLYRYVVQSYPNSNIKWEVAEQANLGVELKMFGDLFETNIDIYQEIRHNILDYRRTIPASMGLEALQLGNVGKSRSRGIDLSAKIQHMINNDFWFILNGTFTYSKAKYLEIEEATDKPEWQLKKGHEISQQIGYIAEGLFRDQAEIDNSPVQGGNVMPGDIRYRDLNNDGVIDVNDATYIGFPTTPRIIYGFSGFFNLKNWELSINFQGSGKRGLFMNPMQIGPFYEDRAMLKAIYEDHWSENNMAERPFWPRLSTQAINTHNPQEEYYPDGATEYRYSTYFMRECRFLRCTAIEVGYNLPRSIQNKLRMQTVKVYARVNNPFLISDFKVWDVELGENGFNYPIQRTVSLGLNISF